jgi:hypothetical protein
LAECHIGPLLAFVGGGDIVHHTGKRVRLAGAVNHVHASHRPVARVGQVMGHGGGHIRRHFSHHALVESSDRSVRSFPVGPVDLDGEDPEGSGGGIGVEETFLHQNDGVVGPRVAGPRKMESTPFDQRVDVHVEQLARRAEAKLVRV